MERGEINSPKTLQDVCQTQIILHAQCTQAKHTVIKIRRTPPRKINSLHFDFDHALKKKNVLLKYPHCDNTCAGLV